MAAHHNRAAVRLTKGDLEGALADFSKAINLDSRLVEAYMDRSNIRYRKGDLDGVISDSTKAIELNPALAEAWNNRALARQEWAEAVGHGVRIATDDVHRHVERQRGRLVTSQPFGCRRDLPAPFLRVVGVVVRPLLLDVEREVLVVEGDLLEARPRVFRP